MNKVFDATVDKAKKLASKKEEVKSVLKKAHKKIGEDPEIGKDSIGKLKLFFQMLQSWLKGTFSFQFRTLVYVVAALLYFINPFDLVPDFIFGIGYLDDASVIALVFKRINKEIERYCRTMDFESVEVVS